MKDRLIEVCERLIRRTQVVLSSLKTEPKRMGADECETLHQIAIAATQERQACEAECDALRMIESAAWEEYWNCITP